MSEKPKRNKNLTDVITSGVTMLAVAAATGAMMEAEAANQEVASLQSQLHSQETKTYADQQAEAYTYALQNYQAEGQKVAFFAEIVNGSVIYKDPHHLRGDSAGDQPRMVDPILLASPNGTNH